jgi:hypothetical protein
MVMGAFLGARVLPSAGCHCAAMLARLAAVAKREFRAKILAQISASAAREYCDLPRIVV